MIRRLAAGALALLLAVAMTACGGGDDATTTTAAPGGDGTATAHSLAERVCALMAEVEGASLDEEGRLDEFAAGLAAIDRDQEDAGIAVGDVEAAMREICPEYG